jgi:hypothetical protein
VKTAPCAEVYKKLYVIFKCLRIQIICDIMLFLWASSSLHFRSCIAFIYLDCLTQEMKDCIALECQELLTQQLSIIPQKTTIFSNATARTSNLASLRMTISVLYTGCNRRNGPNFGRVFLMLNYTEKTQNTYIQS